MKNKPKGLKCPQCNKPIGFAEQAKEIDDLYGEDVMLTPDSPWFTNIFCENCEEATVLMFVESAGKGKEVYSPALKDKIKIPTRAKN